MTKGKTVGGEQQSHGTQQALRVLVVTQWFSPEPARTVHLTVKACMQRGFSIRVLTGAPNYPTGTIYSGYRNGFYSEARTDGLQVHHVYEYPSHSGSKLGRVLNYLTFSVSAVPVTLRLSKWADIVYVHGSPVTTAVGALVAKHLYGIPYIVHAQDLWPESIEALLPNKRFWWTPRLIAHVLSQKVYKTAIKVVVISPGAAHRLVDRGVNKKNVAMIMNTSTQFDRAAVKRGARTGRRKLLYAGNMGTAQSLDTLITEVARNGRVRLTLAGDGVEKEHLKNLVENLGTANISVIDASYDGAFYDLVAAHDVMILSLKGASLFEYTVPSKLQTIAASGTPILGICGGDAGRLITRGRCGWVVPPESPAALAETLNEIESCSRESLQALGRAARALYEGCMSYDQYKDAITDVLSNPYRFDPNSYEID